MLGPEIEYCAHPTDNHQQGSRNNLFFIVEYKLYHVRLTPSAKRYDINGFRCCDGCVLWPKWLRQHHVTGDVGTGTGNIMSKGVFAYYDCSQREWETGSHTARGGTDIRISAVSGCLGAGALRAYTGDMCCECTAESTALDAGTECPGRLDHGRISDAAEFHPPARHARVSARKPVRKNAGNTASDREKLEGNGEP